jgi:hypothetical protein
VSHRFLVLSSAFHGFAITGFAVLAWITHRQDMGLLPLLAAAAICVPLLALQNNLNEGPEA